MRAMFGLVGLLVVLVIVGVLARKQLTAVKSVAPGDAPPATVREQSQQMQQRAQQDVQRALEQGAARASDAAQ